MLFHHHKHSLTKLAEFSTVLFHVVKPRLSPFTGAAFGMFGAVSDSIFTRGRSTAGTTAPGATATAPAATAVHEIDLFDVSFTESSSVTDNVLHVRILGSNSQSSASKSGFSVMHNGFVVVPSSFGINVGCTLFVEVVLHAFLDVIPYDCNVTISVWSALLVVQTNGVSDFVDDSSFSPTSAG